MQGWKQSRGGGAGHSTLKQWLNYWVSATTTVNLMARMVVLKQWTMRPDWDAMTSFLALLFFFFWKVACSFYYTDNRRFLHHQLHLRFQSKQLFFFFSWSKYFPITTHSQFIATFVVVSCVVVFLVPAHLLHKKLDFSSAQFCTASCTSCSCKILLAPKSSFWNHKELCMARRIGIWAWSHIQLVTWVANFPYPKVQWPGQHELDLPAGKCL